MYRSRSIKALLYPLRNRAIPFALGCVLISLFAAPPAAAQIPASQRQALEDLYNATGGPTWTNRSAWLDGTAPECSWYGVYCDSFGTNVEQINLAGNNLSGTIPASIGNLNQMMYVHLSSNRLTGTIPSSFGTLPLHYLDLASTQLTGSIPSSFSSLVNLSPGNLDLRWNGLYSTDPSLVTFLNSKQVGGDWQSTQTIAPSGIVATTVGLTSIQLTWSTIPFTAGPGYYEVFQSPTSGGTYVSVGQTANKSANAFLVNGLSPATTYYFSIRTVSLPHANNSYTVTSQNSSPVPGSTASCTYTLVPASASAVAAGESGKTFQVQSTAGCAWTAVSNSTWITVTAGASGTGTGTVTYQVAANPGAARSGTITAGGQTFTVSQTAASCTYSLVPTSASAVAAGESGKTFQVQTASGCAWTAVSNSTWITVTAGASGTGTGTVTYQVAANPGAARSGTITAGGQTFTVSQTAASCTYTLVPTSASAVAAGESGKTFQVQTASGCAWTAVSNSTWITVTAGASGTGTGTVTYQVAANPGAARSGTITAGGQTFTVSQTAASCTYTLVPTSASAVAAGESGKTFQVQTASGCAWTAVSNSTWITVTAGASGTGTGTVTYQVAANPGAARSGTITAGGQTFTVSQTAANCAYTLVPTSASAVAAGESGKTFQVQTASGCAWTAVSNSTWITVTAGASGTGTGTVTYQVAANPGAARSGTITAGGQTFTVAQAAAGCSQPPVPVFTSIPAGTVNAGSSFTVAWSSVLSSDSGGRYAVDVSSNDSCSNPTRISTQQTSLTIPTRSGETRNYCIAVTAITVGGCASDASSSARVAVVAPPATFSVVGVATPAIASKNEPVPTGVNVILRNVGSTSGGLSIAGEAGLFDTSPSTVSSVEPGQDVIVQIQFAPTATGSSGLKSGNLTATWSRGSLSTPIALTVFEGPVEASAGSKLTYVSSNEVHFRHRGSGNPANQNVTIKNTGSAPVNLVPKVGPGGAWLSVSGDFATPIPPLESRVFNLSVDRSKRTTADGLPPLVTNLIFVNAGGRPEDSAYGQVFDEEPLPPVAGAGRPALKSQEFSLILGSVVNAQGQGANFVSEAWIQNLGGSEATADLFCTPNGMDGLTGDLVGKNTVTLAPYATYRLSDLVKGLFQAEDVSGQVEFRSAQMSQLSIRSTADAITSKENGIARYGAEIPLAVSGQGVRKGSAGDDSIAILAGLRDSTSGFRTNIILAETSGKRADVRVRLFDTEGRLLGQRLLTVLPYSKMQINSTDTEVFPPGKSYEGGTAEVLPEGGGGSVAVFATIIDNASGSYATRGGEIFRISETGSIASKRNLNAARPAFLPATTRSAALNNSYYTTRLVLVNLSRNQARLTLTYLPDQGPAVTRDVTLPARAEGPTAWQRTDVLGELFGLQQDSSGMIRFDGELAPISVAAETSTPLDLNDPGKGRSVSAVNPAPGKPESEAYGVHSVDSTEVIGTLASGSPRAVITLPAIEEGFAFRTNLILAELSGEASEIKVRIIKSGNGGAALGEKNYDLQPYQRLQRNRVVREVLGLSNDDPRAEFKDIEIEVQAVSGNGRVLAIVTRIDNNPASKRADIFTLGPAVTSSPVSFGD